MTAQSGRFLVALRGSLGTLMVLLVALGVRLAFVNWAPGRISGDARWYHVFALMLHRGAGYVEWDGSPAIQWMPGWPLLLAGLYASFGSSPRVGMLANALLGAATAALLATLGARLFRREVGIAAGSIYAVWPGVVYFTATLMTETLFSFLLVSSLTLVAVAVARPHGPRIAWCVAAGVVFGCATLIKAEPLALLPVLLLFLWTSLRRTSSFLRAASAFALAVALVLAPWVVRNYLHFGRVLVTSASGGLNVWIGNHDQARGGEMMNHAIRYATRHKGANRAETLLAMNESGWSDAMTFVKSDPGQEAQILLRKLRLTYGSDDGGVVMLQGVATGPDARFLAPVVVRRLSWVANAFWYAALALAAIGVTSARAWSAPARVLVLGLPATWLLLHLVFLGGPRFHVPEIPAIALAAGAGMMALAERADAALERRTS